MIKPASLYLLTGLTALALQAPLAAAETAPRTTLVLDASGSMWGQIDGVAKITIAKEVVGDLIRRLPDEMEVGLTVYGHRRKGDCNDIETLFAPAAHQKSDIVSSVNGISPKGKTPLSAAVLKAAEALRYTEEKASVILISDGEETCSLDPCAVARDLEQAGIDFAVHTVGFDVSDAETRRQLQCLAAETGGTFHSAHDAASLAKALNSIAEEKPAPERVHLDAPASAPAGAPVSVGWEGPAKEGDFLAFVERDGNADTLLSSADLRDGSPLSVQAPPAPGPHDLIYVDYATGSVLARAPIDIQDVAASLSAPSVASAGGLIEISWQGPAGGGDYVTIAKAGAPLPESGFYFDVAEGSPAQLQMPSAPGDYEIRYITNTDPRVILAHVPLTVEDVDLTLKAPASAKAGTSVKVLWNGTTNPKDYIAFALPDEPLPHILSMAETGEGNPLSVPVPDTPGAYELRYFFAEGDRIVQRIPITVE
ncbi:VWA domain-containing protein [Labrenzia sp. VG12]|uniref:vWA domain-containing protein n=1 Tax=Labrenzia sp. VG12 TaxID=2021862 RepID=UPI000B8C6611|nr:VWA domain-containing protein [Labrenzia sp. VG12]ASP33859.1 VWA domain-containing protein [Labrenzia sp. VG12]